MAELFDMDRTFFETMTQGAFVQLADGSLVDVNPTALSLFGVTREEFFGRTSEAPEWLVVQEDGTPLAPEQHPSMVALRTGEAVHDFVAGVYNHQKQCFVWMSINAVPLFRPGEATPCKAYVTMHDISEQKKLNDIHLSRIHLRQFADSHTMEELLVEVLDDLERLTGSTIAFYNFFDERTKHVTLKAYSTNTTGTFCKMTVGQVHSIEEGGVWTDCIRNGEAIIHNDYAALPHRRGLPPGHAPIIRELVVPVKRNGETVAILGVGNKPVHYSEADLKTVSLFADLTWDIAERKKMEDSLIRGQNELVQANELLEQRVLQRTADLQMAIREQESFSYSVSHDLRAPLRHINSYSAILMDEYADDLPSQARDYLLRMQATSHRMGSLIDHLLELSRVSRTEVQMGQVHLSVLTETILGTFKETEPHRNLQQRIQPGIVVHGDKYLLHQLLQNLLENAWKYTSMKPCSVIEFGMAVISGREVYLVKDDGVGFDMAYKENLFKPFERLHGEEFEGVGIGLATAKRIVDRHGGEIWAEGSVGEGATIYFTLPSPQP
jgi:signal transduction histidine kinase